jgi:hypothetical protein
MEQGKEKEVPKGDRVHYLDHILALMTILYIKILPLH